MFRQTPFEHNYHVSDNKTRTSLVSEAACEAGRVDVGGGGGCFLSHSPKANSLKFKDGLHGGWQNKCLLHPAERRPWRHFSQKLSCSLQLFGKTLPRWCLPHSPTSTHMVMTTSRTKTGSPHGSRPWLDHSLYQNKPF